MLLTVFHLQQLQQSGWAFLKWVQEGEIIVLTVFFLSFSYASPRTPTSLVLSYKPLLNHQLLWDILHGSSWAGLVPLIDSRMFCVYLYYFLARLFVIACLYERLWQHYNLFIFISLLLVEWLEHPKRPKMFSSVNEWMNERMPQPFLSNRSSFWNKAISTFGSYAVD